MSTKSFSVARKSFVNNLNDVMTKLNLFPTTLAFKLNATSQNNNVVTSQTINEWLEGKKVPSLYAYYKLCQYLNVSMDELLDEKFNTNTATGKAFAAQSINTPKVTVCCIDNMVDINAEDLLHSLNQTPISTIKETTMSINTTTSNTTNTTASITTTTTTTKRDRTPATERKNLVYTRTSSDKVNAKLAYAILKSGMTMEELAETTGISIRSLRNYAYYGVSISPERAYILLKTLKSCNYATLGLRLSTDTKRYVAV